MYIHFKLLFNERSIVGEPNNQEFQIKILHARKEKK